MASDEFLGGEKAVISDTRDFALVVLVDHNGVADVQASIEKPQAAAWLRYIADSWDPSGAAAGASTPVCPHIETSDEGTSHCTLAVAGATSVAPPAPTAGAELIAAERRRQVEAEGWTPEHDAEHTEGDLIEAAIAYAVEAAPTPLAPEGWPWPWHADYWKPTADPARNLIKAGALIAAELDRLLAAGSSPAGVPQKDDR